MASSFRFYRKIENDLANATIEREITDDTVSRYGPKMTVKRLRNLFNKQYDERVAKLDEVSAAGIPMEATITVDWKTVKGKSRPRATLSYTYIGGDGKNHKRKLESSRAPAVVHARSAAIAEVLNDSPEFSKLIYDAREDGKKAGAGADLSEGSGSLPIYRGEGGDDAQEATLRKLGYDVDTVSKGDGMEVISIRRKADSKNSGASMNRKSKRKSGRR